MTRALWAASLLALAAPAGARAEVRAVPLDERCREGVCRQLAVSCGGLPERRVVVRQFPSRGGRGTVILTTGGFGAGRYNKLPLRGETQRALVEAGFEVFQVEWQGEDGWATGAWGAGFTRVLCAYAEVVRWIVRELAANPEVVCAQGNSGGSLQNGYGLAVYDLEQLFDMVIMSGGPPVTRLDRYCFPERPRDLGRRPDAAPAEPRMAATTGRTLVDRVMGYEGTTDYCKRVDLPAEPGVVEALQRESLVPPLAGEARDFDHRATRVNFVESVDDRAARQGRIYFEALAGNKAWYDIPGGVHQVDNTPEGAAKIRELFEAECRPQRAEAAEPDDPIGRE